MLEADANMPSRANGGGDPRRRDNRWARQISAELGSVLLDTLGLAATIEWHVGRFQKCTGIVCELTVKNAAGIDLPEDCAATILDIHDEVLRNVARHAGASRVAIALSVTPHEVTLVVRDNGNGLANEALASGAGGLAAMRASSLSRRGFCNVAGTNYAGTTVTVSLPIA